MFYDGLTEEEQDDYEILVAMSNSWPHCIVTVDSLKAAIGLSKAFRVYVLSDYEEVG